MLTIPLLLIITITSFQVNARDFGRIHNTFPVKEERFLEMIEKKMKGVNINQVQKDWEKDVTNQVKNLKGQNIKRANSYKKKVVDVTYKVPKDIVAEGKTYYKAGTIVNPLDYMELDYRIFIFDGKDNKQLGWIKEQKLEDRDMLILTNGSPEELSKELNRKVYFDLLGEITKKFKIEALPSVISQKDKEIIVEEHEPNK